MLSASIASIIDTNYYYTNDSINDSVHDYINDSSDDSIDYSIGDSICDFIDGSEMRNQLPIFVSMLRVRMSHHGQDKANSLKQFCLIHPGLPGLHFNPATADRIPVPPGNKKNYRIFFKHFRIFIFAQPWVLNNLPPSSQ